MKKSRPSFIGNYKDFIEEDNNKYPGSEELLCVSSPVGKMLGLTKIGIHIGILEPGRRTSWPHAESHEEEFVYVIEGTPQVWIDGDIYDLVPGDFVAWPSGTGISHSILNNTDKTCLILVGGETDNLENKIFYPMHPKRNEELKKRGSYWEDHPEHPLGPHDGIPDLQK